MNGDAFVLFSLQIAAMLAVALIFGQAMRRLHQPALLGEMIGGIVLGPTILGMIAPSLYESLFPAGGTVSLVRATTIKLGMLFFLFAIGLEIDLASLRKHGVTAILVGVIGTMVPLAAGVLTVYLLPSLWIIPGDKWAYALFLGACLANSANPVLARILIDLDLMKKDLGAILMSATIVDDLVGWCLLALIFGNSSDDPLSQGSALAGILSVFAFLIGLLLLAHWICMPLLRLARRRLAWPGGYLGFAIVMILLSAAAAEWLGIHAFLGPFLLGIGLAPTEEERIEAYEVMNKFVLSLFVPIYFVSMGLTSNFITNFDVRLVSVILGVATLSKVAAAYLGARLSGVDSRTSLAIGFGMNARGATGIILASLGLENGVIEHRAYVALVIMALVTSILAGPLMKIFLDRRATPVHLQSPVLSDLQA